MKTSSKCLDPGAYIPFQERGKNCAEMTKERRLCSRGGKWLKKKKKSAKELTIWGNQQNVMGVFIRFVLTVNNLSVLRETPVRSLGWKDPLEKEMATYPSIQAWRIPWTEEPGGLQFMGLQRVRHD